jgi:S-phase kinase-associated protein 1
MTEQVKLLCSDGDEVEVDVEVAQKSVLIKGLIDDSGVEEQIPLPNVKRPILEKVIAFCTHLKDHQPPEIEKPLRSTDMASVVDPWYAEYINLEQEVLFELIMASNYLDIKPLLELACAKVASLIKNKTIEEIRKFFNIENDFTPEEEAQIMEENKWAEQSF